MNEHVSETTPLELTVDIAVAWLSNPSTRATADEVASFVASTHSALVALAGTSATTSVTPAEAVVDETAIEPAVSVRKSLASQDFILSLIDGKPYKTLRRHLAIHGFTPESYRERFGLKPDYPMTAPAYSRARSEMAKSIGLGRIPKGK